MPKDILFYPVMAPCVARWQHSQRYIAYTSMHPILNGDFAGQFPNGSARLPLWRSCVTRAV